MLFRHAEPWSRGALVRNCACLAASLILLPAQGWAQVGMRVHDVGFGISISLPATWAADTDAELAALREQSLRVMRGSDLEHLQEFARDNENALLFLATEEGASANSVSFNVTVGAAAEASAFNAASGDEVAAMVYYLCGLFEAEARELGGTGSCIRHEIRTLEDRAVLVIHQRFAVPSSGINNRRVVAMIPSDGLLFTLSISVAETDFNAGMVSTVLASLQMPDGM